MAAVTGAVVAGAASAYGAYQQGQAAKDAARSANRGIDQGIAEQRRQFDLMRGDLMPYMDFGKGGIDLWNKLMAGDYSGFENSPDYLYARDQTQQGVERGAASRGSLYSGGTNVDLANALNGIASQNLGRYQSNLFNQIGIGQNAASGAASLGQQNANALSNLYMQRGQNSADAAINSANAWSNGLAGIGSALGALGGARQSSYKAPQTGWGAFTPNQGSSGGIGYTGGYQNWLSNLGNGWMS